MEREIETIRESPHWSYSALQTYLTCPMRYYFRYIEHAEVERTPISIPFGRAFHLVLSDRAQKGTVYTIQDAKEDFAVYFKGETEVCENLTYKQDEDYWFWDKRGCEMLDVAMAEWPDDYLVKSVAEAFSVNVPGLSKPLGMIELFQIAEPALQTRCCRTETRLDASIPITTREHSRAKN